MNSEIITRFAPSPTGFLHIGSVRAALFNYLFSKQHKGKILLRIEDTDKERSKKEFEDDIIKGFEWLGLSFDGTTIQSERASTHKDYLQKMIADEHAYISKETDIKEGGRAEVIRFKNPNKTITFHDIIRGDITFDTTELGDFVIAKSLDEPLYHLAVVIDDHEMNITHVIRGEDHISNTPRQILIQQAIGASTPIYAHLPLVLAKDKSKLSKRKHGESVSLKYYIEKGYLPEAILNYLALLGWNPGTDQEIFSLDQLIQTFDLSKVQKSGAVFDEEKLKWMNKEYIRHLPPEVFLEKMRPIISEKYPLTDDTAKKIAPLLLERISLWSEVKDMIDQGELDYIFNAPSYEATALLWKGKGELTRTNERLTKVISLIEEVQENMFTRDLIKESIWSYAEEQGRGDVLWPMRYALSGRERSPDPFVVAELIGKKETIRRLMTACDLVSK